MAARLTKPSTDLKTGAPTSRPQRQPPCHSIWHRQSWPLGDRRRDFRLRARHILPEHQPYTHAPHGTRAIKTA